MIRTYFNECFSTRESCIDLAAQFDRECSLDKLLKNADAIYQFLETEPLRRSELTFAIQAAMPHEFSGDVRNLLYAARRVLDFTDNGPADPSAIEFIGNAKIPHPTKNIVRFNLHDFQKRTIRYLDSSQALIINHARQMGITSLLSLYALYEAMTKPEQTILLAGPRYSQGLSMMDRIQFTIENLDLRSHNVQLVEYTKGAIVFSNGSRILSCTVGPDMARGRSITRLILDNAGHVSFSHLAETWTSVVLPLIHNGGKIVMSSSGTVNDGMFYRVWVHGTHPWRKLMLPWYEHPERDDAWADGFRASLDNEQFAQEMECTFVSK